MGAKCRLYVVAWTKSLFGLYVFESMHDEKVKGQWQRRGKQNGGEKARALVDDRADVGTALETMGSKTEVVGKAVEELDGSTALGGRAGAFILNSEN